MAAPHFSNARGCLFRIATAAAVLLASNISSTALTPYSVDSATLHLWHLDEATTPCADAVSGGSELTSLSGGASLNAFSFPGFGTALNTVDGGQSATSGNSRNAALSALPLANGSEDNVAMNFADAVTGAFTFEALVRIDFDPSQDLIARGSGMQILSAEGDDADASPSRLFQWRIDPIGVGGGDDRVPRLEFINLRQGFGIQSVVTPIPTTGSHAIVSNGWYHAAISYSGDADVSGNLRFYWTALNETNAGANLIGTARLNEDLSDGVAADFCIGNEGRSVSGATDNFLGLIDEVRISGVARGAFDFYWGTNSTIPNPPLTDEPILPGTTYFPVDDGNADTSEFGYAGSSAINAVAFICSGLKTVGDQQFLTYYGRHQSDPAYEFNNTIWVARRTIGSNRWEVFRTTFKANAITDGHDVVCFGIDGEGFMHISWGMHGDSFHYARSLKSVTGSEPIAFGPDTTMTGAENTATYPQFLTLPGGDLIYIYRKGSSGAGDTYINRYVLASKTWTNVHASGDTVLPFIKGTGWPLDYNAYGQMPCVDADGKLFLVWTWRYTPAFQSNHDFAFAMSPDSGVSWQRSDGRVYTLPIDESVTNGSADPETVAERIFEIPQDSTLINQAGMCLDQDGRPVIATWWAPGSATNNFRRQYMLALADENSAWHVRQISNRTNDPPGTIQQDAAVRDLGRPVVVCDRDGRIIVLYRDNAGSNGLTIVHSLPQALDPERNVWITVDLTTANLGNYEPVIDLARWQRDNILSILYQPSSGLGYTPPANNASEIGVLEWNAAAYFAHRSALNVTLQDHDAVLSFRSQPGWSYRVQASNDLSQWTNVITLPGTGGFLKYVRTNALDERQFWRLEIREGSF
ncbi:MAG TPA: BNR-4 repeat-containing protein [Verrucomicrobiae bacterium]|nr:BNR-4 repeat-containing protein [Verrucomicrobiae bacterium]